MSSRDQRKARKPLLLIVDDNRDTAIFLQRLLEHETGWEVTSTGSVADALARLKERAPDAALLDYSLPDGTGVDIARELRAVSRKIPIIIMSGLREDELREHQGELSTFTFFHKPFLAQDIKRHLVPVVLSPEKISDKAEVFFSYSHKDGRFRDELEKHLSLLKRNGEIHAWYDGEIEAGCDFIAVINTQLERADIILLLVSPDYIASDFCYGAEMRRALERHDSGDAVVIPVILRPVDWHESPFGKLLALPKDGKPISKWASRDAAFLNVVEGIKKSIRRKS